MTGLSRIFSQLEPFDLMFKNFFDTDAFFVPFTSSNSLRYPVDVREEDDRLVIDIAVVGLDKDDVDISVEDDSILRVSYSKDAGSEDTDKSYIKRGITKKSFNFGWKISNKFDLNRIEASMEKGLLTICVSKAKKIEPKRKLIAIR